jgi:hypothetical protein
MQKPLLEKTTEENLKALFSQAGYHLQKIKDYTNQIDKEVIFFSLIKLNLPSNRHKKL